MVLFVVTRQTASSDRPHAIRINLGMIDPKSIGVRFAVNKRDKFTVNKRDKFTVNKNKRDKSSQSIKEA